MEDETKQSEVQETPIAVAAAVPSEPARGPRRGGNTRSRGRGGKEGNRRGRTGGKREDRQRSEFDQRTILVRRVARVMAGGRRFNFSAAIVAGDRKGRVGVGLGKGLDTALAIEKALRDAKKNMIMVRTTKTMSIP
ncbi:30S ribosomal protein S5, partial [Candidatus Kaiserbacteria bacterium]|nr:30S ribosomal protein S5 [Candidatus Kaiserbacteria bacterium]